ncbi:hypothetical protein MN608_07360 [Microdochium nivale]|nr:hypothetical protein MN608_07360 [Microdochium nivale]
MAGFHTEVAASKIDRYDQIKGWLGGISGSVPTNGRAAISCNFKSHRPPTSSWQVSDYYSETAIDRAHLAVFVGFQVLEAAPDAITDCGNGMPDVWTCASRNEAYRQLIACIQAGKAASRLG